MVAREYGIPCVVNVAMATRLIKSGELILYGVPYSNTEIVGFKKDVKIHILVLLHKVLLT